MKFLKKINSHYLMTLTMLLVLISIGGYIMLRGIISSEIKEDIAQKEYAIIQQLKVHQKSIEVYPYYKTKRISRKEIVPATFKHIYLMDELEDETEPYLEYTNSVDIDGQWYLIQIRHSIWETDELIAAIAIPLLLLLVLSFVFSFLFAKKLNRSLWRDFEDNLKQIENYSFRNSKDLSLRETHIDEFDRLNKSILKMTGKLRNDYLSLKEFTENASHEIQTPVSIALLHLEELLQEPCSEPGFKMVVATINSLKRLSSLMESLLLLTKIENQQFKPGEMQRLNDLFKNNTMEYQSLMESMKLKLDWEIIDDFILEINPFLAEIFVGNLLLNAIKHNRSGGWIHIYINQSEIRICNTGPEISLTDKTIFKRFTKEKSKSHGLGLAIVKNICEKHFLEIHYSKGEGHCFTIKKISGNKQ